MAYIQQPTPSATSAANSSIRNRCTKNPAACRIWGCDGCSDLGIAVWAEVGRHNTGAGSNTGSFGGAHGAVGMGSSMGDDPEALRIPHCPFSKARGQTSVHNGVGRPLRLGNRGAAMGEGRVNTFCSPQTVMIDSSTPVPKQTRMARHEYVTWTAKKRQRGRSVVTYFMNDASLPTLPPLPRLTFSHH